MVAAASQLPIAHIVQQHVEEAALLRNMRSVLVRAPHVKLRHLKRLDERLAAHLDGVAVAGSTGLRLCDTALENPGTGEVFAAAARAIEEQDVQRLGRLLALAESVVESRGGLLSAFGWVQAPTLRGLVGPLFRSGQDFPRLVAINACTLHRVDAGAMLESAAAARDGRLRARALQAIAEVGRSDLLRLCTQGANDDDSRCAFAAVWSATLLGDRSGVRVLRRLSAAAGPLQQKALQVLLMILDVEAAYDLLKELARMPVSQHILIRCAGISGNPAFIPWLISRMEHDETARSAGESFSLITGTDLAELDLERKPPENFESGPNDDPNDPNVDMDEDDGLPWPDHAKIQAWWAANGQRLQPGVRYFMGGPVNRENCLRVLKEGFQRQRILAAHYLCLLNPGTVLFNTSAPAWRQQRLLAQMN